mgnify:CR=1 FL=1
MENFFSYRSQSIVEKSVLGSVKEHLVTIRIIADMGVVNMIFQRTVIAKS